MLQLIFDMLTILTPSSSLQHKKLPIYNSFKQQNLKRKNLEMGTPHLEPAVINLR